MTLHPFLLALAMLLLTCCGQTQNTAGVSPIIQPPEHPVINLVMIGIQEDFHALPASEPLPVGAEFCLDSSAEGLIAPGLVPCIEPKTVAGTVLTIGQLLAWREHLEAYGFASSHMTMQLAAVPDKTASVSQEKTAFFTSNWTSDNRGTRKKHRATSRSGAIVTATPSLSEDPDILDIDLKSRISNVQLDRIKVAHGVKTDNPGDAIPMMIDLPTRTFQHLDIKFTLEYGQAMVLAHEIVRPRDRPSVRQHTLYLAALTRSPVWPKRATFSNEPQLEQKDALVMYWPQYLDRIDIKPQTDIVCAAYNRPTWKGISSEMLLSRLDTMSDDEMLDSTLLGIVLSKGCAASFNGGVEHSYVCGVTNDTSPQGTESQKFDVRAVHSGMNLQYVMGDSASSTKIDTNVRLATAPRIVSVTEQAPSLRRPLQNNILEKSTFQTSTQHTLKLDQALHPNAKNIWELKTTFQNEMNGTPMHSEDAEWRGWAVLYYQRHQEHSTVIHSPDHIGLPDKAPLRSD